jgi:hypothetical protein
MLLENLQAELADAILSGNMDCHVIRPSKNITIYQNNITSTLVQTLKHIYPLVANLLHEDFFSEIAKRYIDLYPSRSCHLFDYGEYFADFLKKFSPVSHLAYLKELAQFEWLCHTVSIAANCTVLDIEALKKVSPEQYQQIHFVLNPASHLKIFHYPILRIIDLCNNPPIKTVDIHEEKTNLFIIRRDDHLSFVELSSAEFIFLNSLHEAKSLGDALTAAVLVDKNCKLEEKLLGWMHDKTIVDYYYEHSRLCSDYYRRSFRHGCRNS